MHTALQPPSEPPPPSSEVEMWAMWLHVGKREKQGGGRFFPPTTMLYRPFLHCNAVYGDDWCQHPHLNHLRGIQPPDSLAAILDSSLMTGERQVADDVCWRRSHGSLPSCQWLSDSSTSSKQTPSGASCIHQKMPLTRSAYLTWKESIIPAQSSGCCAASRESSHKQTHSVKAAATLVSREHRYFSDCRKGTAFPYVFLGKKHSSSSWPGFSTLLQKKKKPDKTLSHRLKN